MTGDASLNPPSPVPVPRRRRRIWPWLLGLLALLLLALTALITAVFYHPTALPWGLQQVPGLTAKGVQGTLAEGDLRIASLELVLPDDVGRLQIDGLVSQRKRFTLWPLPGLTADLHFSKLSIQRLRWTSGKPGDKPPTLPTSLRLPVSVLVDRLFVAELLVDKLPPVTGLQAALQLSGKEGGEHALRDLQLVFEQASLSGGLRIGSDAPLPVSARLAARHTAEPAWDAGLTLEGPLAKLAADLQLKGAAPAKGQAPALSAQASLTPFEAWPLQALQLATQALDLSSISAQLPRTALSGSARLQSSAMDAPAQVQASLSNALPGAWHNGRLPLRQLSITATGQPDQTDRLTLDKVDLQLGDEAGPAGRVRGKGQWQGMNLALDLQLTDLLPERLDKRTAPILVSGPIKLRASGLLPARSGAKAEPVLDFDAQLAGRTTDRSGQPVTLQLDGQAGARHLLLRSAQAASGQASATARADIRADASGWALKGEVALKQFNPLPWWPGPPGSAWRRGPHRLDGQLALDMHFNTGTAAATGAAPATGLHAAERLLRALDGQAKLQLDNSQLSGLPVQAALTLRSGAAVLDADISARIAGNQISLKGQLDKRLSRAQADDRAQLALQMPALAALAPLARLIDDIVPGASAHWPSAGALSGEAVVDGRWPQLKSEGQLRIQGLASADARLQQANLVWQGGSDLDAPLNVSLDATGLGLPPRPGAAGAAAHPARHLDAINARITGTPRQHQITLRADSPVRPPAWAENLLGPLGTGTRVDLATSGGWLPEAGGGGRWQVQNLQLQTGARLATSTATATAAAAKAAPAAGKASVPAAAAAAAGPWMLARTPLLELSLNGQFQPTALRAEPGRLELLSTALTWTVLDWQAAAPGAAARLNVEAQLETIDVAALLARLQPGTGWGGKLSLGGRIDIRSADKVDADIVLERRGGDLSLTDDLGETLSLGLSDLRLVLGAHDGVWQFAQGLAGERLGQVAGAQVLRTAPGERFPSAGTPLSGTLEARVANIGVWSAWVPPGWRLAGQVRTSAAVGGTLSAPEFSGEMRGSGIGARNLLQGVNLSEGELAITLSGDKASIERFVFKGGDGTLSLSGGALLGAAPSAQLQLKVDKFRLLGRIDRRLVASGQAEVQLNADSLRVDGDLRVDEGLFDISRGDAPSLDDDVTVRRGGVVVLKSAADSPAVATPKPLRQANVSLRIDLGERLRLRGHGIDTGLRGKLVASTPGGRLALNGTIRLEDGKFAAYGQKMAIRTGEIDFIGPLDNPRMNIKALRTDIDTVVGVTVTGSATAPRVRLYSEPDMSEFDKLSWLVMGRAPSSLGSGDTALLQSAALAVLAGDQPGAIDKLTGALGLTDFSVRQSDGDSRDTVVTLGKQLSQRWYVGYERSVNATTGTWQLIYKVAQRFTLRAQSGSDTALDAIWSWRW